MKTFRRNIDSVIGSFNGPKAEIKGKVIKRDDRIDSFSHSTQDEPGDGQDSYI